MVATGDRREWAGPTPRGDLKRALYPPGPGGGLSRMACSRKICRTGARAIPVVIHEVHNGLL